MASTLLTVAAKSAAGPESAVAKLFGEEPRQQLADDLKRFREVLEKTPSAG